jgi:hypothetical protein
LKTGMPGMATCCMIKLNVDMAWNGADGRGATGYLKVIMLQREQGVVLMRSEKARRASAIFTKGAFVQKECMIKTVHINILVQKGRSK